MADIIQLLPDSIANQIAAGEVVQRPASVVKELMENSVDAEATSIQVSIRDGGKALIQVVDDGIGMSETDARLCFERHATSKIREAADLFSIRTMGFRGEALASIAAVAEVELRTRKANDALGTQIRISASDVVSHEPISCPQGSSFGIKNLFFNIPARRKFLKSSSLELKHIISEFQRVALGNPSIAMSLLNNGSYIYNLPASGIKQRVVGIFGRSLNQQMLDLNTQTSVINVTGFIGKPECAKKSAGEQFFFVNNRYMKSPYLHRAVLKAFDKLIPNDVYPTYFIFLEANPQSIDVNIHPTKTEIKFEDERVVWQILFASVRETLGKFAVVPSIDFDTEGGFDIPFFPKSAPVSPPEIEINPFFNPFEAETKEKQSYVSGQTQQRKAVDNWQDLFQQEQGKGFEAQLFSQKTSSLDDPQPVTEKRFYQLKNRYILTAVKSGLMIVDQRRAHERILFEGFLASLQFGQSASQQELFPETIELNPGDYALIGAIKSNLLQLGVELSDLGGCTISVNALPAALRINSSKELVDQLLFAYKNNQSDAESDLQHKVAISLAKASAIPYSKSLTQFEMQELIDKLFACKNPNFSPTGKPTVSIMGIDELEKRFR